MGLISIVGLIILIAAIFARKAIKEVNLNGALRFYFLLLWVSPIELFCVLTLIDLFRVTDVWVEHWWHSDSFQWFREFFCLGSDPKKCSQPSWKSFDSMDIADACSNSTLWCMENFQNDTDCTEVLQNSKSNFKEIAFLFYIANGVWGVLMTILVSFGSNPYFWA